MEGITASFVWLAVTTGALSLLTPCVFPMVPITVSYFAQRPGTDRRSSLRSAAIFCLGIIATFTALGLALAILVGATGINRFAANPWVNLLLTLIFLGFAVNFFGGYEIRVPTGLIDRVDTKARGASAGRGGSSGSGIGALLMGLTFTLTSFTCTAPFVGTLLVLASRGDWQQPLVGMLVFSTVFALPFFVLALAPQWLARLPKSGGWLNSVKVVMGFLEIAAAIKFLSNVDLVWKWNIFTHDVVVASWVAISLVTALYLLGKITLAHDRPAEHLGAGRLLAAIGFMGVGFWLSTGLLGRSLGELESFLPPRAEATAPSINAAGSPEPVWMTNDLQGSLAVAREAGKLVFIDFTGYTCTNCRWMEANMFPRPEVREALNEFVLARLFTDGEGQIYEKQQAYQQEKFGTVALPLYAVVDAEENVIATFAGLTREADEFVQFLRTALRPVAQ